LYSAAGQKIRIEWITESGGSAKAAWGIDHDGGSETENMLDTRCLISNLKRSQFDLLDKAIVERKPVLIRLETDVNLKTRPNFVIVQRLDTKYWTGNGVGSGAIWTPDSPPGWTADAWTSFWLWFSDKRFEITSNTTTALTVDLDGKTLPASSTSSEIVAVKEWYPILNIPDLADGMDQPLGDSQLSQALICTKLPYVGDQA